MHLIDSLTNQLKSQLVDETTCLLRYSLASHLHMAFHVSQTSVPVPQKVVPVVCCSLTHCPYCKANSVHNVSLFNTKDISYLMLLTFVLSNNL